MSDDPFEFPMAPYEDTIEGIEEAKRAFSTMERVEPKPELDDVPIDESPRATPQVHEFDRIVESVFNIDYAGNWERILAALKQGEDSRKSISPRKQLQVIDERCREAHKFFVNMKLALHERRCEIEKVQAAMRLEAQHALQSEKDAGTRTKTITDADVKAKMIDAHPDEIHSQEISLKKLELAVEHFEAMVKFMSQRSRSLQVEVARGVSSGADD